MKSAFEILADGLNDAQKVELHELAKNHGLSDDDPLLCYVAMLRLRDSFFVGGMEKAVSIASTLPGETDKALKEIQAAAGVMHKNAARLDNINMNIIGLMAFGVLFIGLLIGLWIGARFL